MADFLLELLSEEIPARMQAKACKDLAALLAAELQKAGLAAEAIETFATPRRLALIARGLPAETEAVREETKGPRSSAPPQALEGFLRKTGLSQDQLVERDGTWFAIVDKPGRPTASVLAEAVPAVVRAFPWPKSMRWGSGEMRWVRPLHGIVALLGEEIVEFEIAGIRSGAATVGHRFHHPGIITIGSANDYAEKLRACHVILDPAERRAIIAEGAAAAARDAGLKLVEDEGLLLENAGLTEWPVPLLGRFDPAFLEVPREVIQLTMRTNQKYFALTDAAGALAPNFVCVANIEASDGGAAIVAGNERVLSARLSDAKFFWEHDLEIPLEQQAEKLSQIVFHEKLGTVADKVERVAKLARWLVEEGIVAAPVIPAKAGISGQEVTAAAPGRPPRGTEHTPPEIPASAGMTALADLAERAARLAKADLVTGLVGEFPELQGIIGGHLARAQGEDAQVADAVRDHYKPVGQGDEVPTAPVTVAVSLADKLDTLTAFFGINEKPTGSKDPFALRRATLGIISLIVENDLRTSFRNLLGQALMQHGIFWWQRLVSRAADVDAAVGGRMQDFLNMAAQATVRATTFEATSIEQVLTDRLPREKVEEAAFQFADMKQLELVPFIGERLIVQQRDAGVRHDIVSAVFALNTEDDLVRLLARVKALQSFVETPEGADLLAGYKRAANILKKEGWVQSAADRHPELVSGSSSSPAGEADSGMLKQVQHDGRPEQGENKPLSYTPEKEEEALIAALDSAAPRAAAAVEAEDFEGAMAALASLRAPVDSFFDKVTVNDPDPAKRSARLDLLARMRDAVHRVADFSKIEG
jgi:glycyl-tRNA synthetase beta chain